MNSFRNILETRAEIAAIKKTDINRISLELEACRRSGTYWCNFYGWTYDPRPERAPQDKPFVLYPAQVELWEWLDKRYEAGGNALIEKSRDVGCTWTVLAWGVHKWLFEDFNFRVGSRKEDYVDKSDDPDSLMWKIRYMLDALPDWMLSSYKSKHMLIVRNGSANAITGEAANSTFARGGRNSVTFFDEFGFWDNAGGAWRSAGESTHLRLAVSTPPETGKSSHFYRLRAQKEGKVDVKLLGYESIPWKNNNWLSKKKSTMSEEEFAREILVSYEGTTKGRVYAKDFKLVPLTDVDYNPRLPLFVSWDLGLDGTALIWWQKDFSTNKLFIIDSYQKMNESPDFFAPFITGLIESGVHKYDDEDLLIIERHKNWAKNITHFGDPNFNHRSNQTKKTSNDQLSKYGIYVQTKPFSSTNSHMAHREAAKLAMRRLEINANRCEHLIECLVSARYPPKSPMSQSTSAPTKPIHDWTSHFRTSFEYFAINEPQIKLRRNKKKKKSRAITW